jgi:hypothetical protein
MGFCLAIQRKRESPVDPEDVSEFVSRSGDIARVIICVLAFTLETS